MGADEEIDLARGEPLDDLAPLLAFFAAGEDRNPHPGALGERRDGLDVLACQNFGRGHQRGLLADFGHGRGGKQRDHGLAGADVALQQAQHPHRLLQIVRDRRGRVALGGRQRVGQGVDDLVAQMPVAGIAHAAGRRSCARIRASASWPASNSSKARRDQKG